MMKYRASAAAALALFVATGCAGGATVHPQADAPHSGGQAATVAAGGAQRIAPNPGAVPVELFVMSQCPFGVAAFNAYKPAIDALGADVDFRITYIGVEQDGQLASMHGPQEITGDIAQLCAKFVAPNQYLELIACQNENHREVDTNWRPCAQKLGIAAESLEACIEGREGEAMLSESFARAHERGVTASPTLLIAGRPYEGRRSADALLHAVCKAHQGTATLSSCASLPPLPTVNVTVLTDSRCPDCETDGLVRAIRGRLSEPRITVADYAEPNGRALFESIGVDNLPVLLFDDTLDTDKEASEIIKPGTQLRGGYRVLSLDGDWNPVCSDPGGCDKEACKQKLTCRKETKNTLEVFVMSQCPYGVRALDAMKEVLSNFGQALRFEIHYIADGTADGGFTSLHGAAEVHENIRELCAAKHFPHRRKYMDYIWCRNGSIRSEDWESCTGQNGISTARIKSCSEGEGKRLHEQDIQLANALGIGASPTWLVNGRYKFNGIDAETIRKNVCVHNPGLKGCENTLSSDVAGGGDGGGCGE